MSKKLILVAGMAIAIFAAACGGGDAKSSDSTADEKAKSGSSDAPSYDPKRGEGSFDETNVKLGPVDAALADKGKSIAETKCFSCHKTTSEKLVGPGWKGVTARHPAHWIMNFITSPDAMIDKDPEVQAQLEICLVRMPNQNLSADDARSIVEFMRQNDASK